MSDAVQVRRLLPGDEQALIDLVLGFKSRAIDAAYAVLVLANRANVVIVVERDGQAGGFLFGYLLDRIDRTARQFFIYEVDVAPEHQRRGVGRALMAWVRAFVAGEGLMEAFVVADRDNVAAAGLYEATGAHVDGGPAVVFVYPGSGQ